MESAQEVKVQVEDREQRPHPCTLSLPVHPSCLYPAVQALDQRQQHTGLHRAASGQCPPRETLPRNAHTLRLSINSTCVRGRSFRVCVCVCVYHVSVHVCICLCVCVCVCVCSLNQRRHRSMRSEEHTSA